MTNFMHKKILCGMFLFITFLKLTVAKDTLSPNETMNISQSLVSKSQLFELGFFSPGNSLNMFLGIWCKATPNTVPWIANRNSPINGTRGVALKVSEDGRLVISRGGSIIWSSNPSGVASNPVLHLLDTGNLVLVDEEAEAKQGHLWQSFDYPVDTWLPGMKLVDDMDAGIETYLTPWTNSGDPSPGEFLYKIDNQGLPDLVIYKGKTKIFRAGKWNGLKFGSYPPFSNPLFQAELDFKGERLVSISRPYNSSIMTRIQLAASGFLQRYTMSSRNDTWNHVYTFPQDKCDVYGYCGPYTICNLGKSRRCDCFEGFSPKNQKEWDLQDWSGGCSIDKPLNCENGDGFREVRGVKYPGMLQFWLNMSMSLGECRDECLRNCSCTAYANPYITNGGTGCVMWLGYLIDVRDLPGADTKQNIYIRLPISELDPTTESVKKKKKNGVLFSGFMFGWILFMRRRKRRASKATRQDLELPLLKLATITAATKDFSRENMIGEGGFGPVYKVTWHFSSR